MHSDRRYDVSYYELIKHQKVVFILIIFILFYFTDSNGVFKVMKLLIKLFFTKLSKYFIIRHSYESVYNL